MHHYCQLACLALITVSLLNCSALREDPVIDKRGVNQAQYEQDLLECRHYAEEVDSARAVIVGSATGAVIGGAVGAAVGNSTTAQRSAGVGAILGGAKGGLRTVDRKERIVQRCLQGRGYRVLG